MRRKALIWQGVPTKATFFKGFLATSPNPEMEGE